MENIKRTILIAIICLIPFICHAVKMTDWTEDTAPSSTDIAWTTKNPATTAVDRKVTLANLFGIGLALDNTWTGTQTITKVNAAGGSADVLTLSGTLGIMNGSDTFRGIYLNYTNANHTGVSNVVTGMYVGAITGDADATERGILVDQGWDEGIASYSIISVYGDGSTTKGVYRMFDLDNSAYVGLTPSDATTSYTLTLPGAAPVSTSFLKCLTTGVCSWDTSTYTLTLAGITGLLFPGAVTDEQLICGNVDGSDITLKSCGAKLTDNSTTSTVLCKDNSGEVENCALQGLSLSGTTTQTLSGVGGTIGTTTNRIPKANGTGGYTLQAGGITEDGTKTDFAALNLVTTGTISGGALTPVIDDADNFAANFTGVNLYGGTFIANAAGTAALPEATAGMNFTIMLETTGDVIIDPLGTGTADTIVMNGLAAAADENIHSTTLGAMCVFQYRAANSWMATCNGFVEATPP